MPDHPHRSPARRGVRPRVLIVEDHPTLARLITRLLQPACEVVVSHCAEDVLASSTDGFDALIVDVGLPGISGIDLLLMLHERDPSVLMRTALVSGSAARPQDPPVLRPVPRILKPFDNDKLRALVARLARRPRALSPVG